MHLLTIEQYCRHEGIDRRTFFRWQTQGRTSTIKIGNKNYVYSAELIMKFSDKDKQAIFDAKRSDWNQRIRDAHLLYKASGKPTGATTQLIKLIFAEVKYFLNLGFNCRGYDLRSLQMKVKTGKTERKRRDEKPFRNNVMKMYPAALDKAMSLCSSYFKDANGSVNLAIDRAIGYAQEHEEFYEVAAVNIHTLRRHIRKAFKQSGYKNLHEFFNHYNIFRTKLPYVKGAFTDDIGFMDVISLDDHKFDVAGVQVWNEAKGEFEKKQIWSWFVVEMKTMQWLAYDIKASPFTSEDIVKLLMKALKSYGAPKVKIICDNGLASSDRVKEFCQKLGIILEPQDAYSPTQKSPNERIHGFMKMETDCYESDYVGSNHPVEGRHTDLKLSPAETLTLENEAIKRYDVYLNTFYLDRPRKLERPDAMHLLDNSGRVSIKKLYEFYYKDHQKIPVTTVQLRYAYMKHDVIKSFKNFYMTFKKEIYLAPPELELVFFDPAYQYTVAYDPNDFNEIDLYASQDIIDRLNGELKVKNEYICTMQSIAALPGDAKKKRIALYNKGIRKKTLELARAMREQYSIHNPLVNKAIDETGVILNVRKEQEKELAGIIRNAVSPDKIENALESTDASTPLSIDEALSEESINKMNAIDIDE